MLKDLQVVAFEGGALRKLDPSEKSREAVLALPLGRLLVKMLRVPADADATAFATDALKAISPYPDDPLTVGVETVREDASGAVVLAAALPESSADDIGEALDAERLSIVRVDLLAIGQLRGLWNVLGADGGRRLVLIKGVDGISLMVIDGDMPSAIRSISDETDLRREVMLSLLEAEDFGGSHPLSGIVVVGDLDVSALEGLAPVRTVEVGEDAALVGVAERTEDPSALNALPDSWREVLEETRFKAKLVKYLSVACGLWVLVMGVLFGVPVAYGFMTDHQKGLSKLHADEYRAVKEKKSKVFVVRKYSNHSRGALEIMKAVSDRLPEGVTLSNWSFKRDEGVRVSGEAETAAQVYEFKNVMEALADGEDGEGEPVFKVVKLNGPSTVKGGMQKFDLDLAYETEESK